MGMQDHQTSMRFLIQGKENIIENLMLRYDRNIIKNLSQNSNNELLSNEIDRNNLHQKSWYLAKQSILENGELREINNDLRDENFHLRNEIYELQDKINRQVLQINKLEKNASDPNNNQSSHEMGTGMM